MRQVTRHISAHSQLLRALGLQGTGQLVTKMWPVWDTIMMGAFYHRGQSFVSSVLADELGLNDRVSPAPSPQALLTLAPDVVDEPTLARHAKFGAWEFVWLGERTHPLPIRPLSDNEFSFLPTATLDLMQLGLAAGAGAFNSDTKWLVVDDEKGAIEVAFEMSEMLGYPPKDHSWIPSAWLAEPVEPGFRIRYDTVIAADELEAVLRSFSVRLNNRFSVYLPRLWFGEQSGAGELTISIPRSDRSTS